MPDSKHMRWADDFATDAKPKADEAETAVSPSEPAANDADGVLFTLRTFLDDEIVINKTASGVFTSTNIQYILRNMEITGLFVVGVYSNECVSTAIRDACDLGFYVTLISDGCATVTPELQHATITTMKDRYARVLTTEEAIAEIRERVEP